ncbi:MAG: class I SAM-dependent methyltransferase [Chlorobiaceae bacterium]|nr:class I SAM-dependent methyltransferase [Chlorobiaceae bacterium]
MHFCRVCGNRTFEAPLIRLTGMPASAQGFPDDRTLHDDSGCDVEVLQCSSCGLVQIPGQPVPYYREVIRSASISPEMQAFRRDQFRRLADKYGLHGRRLLEIGCGKGEYLSLLRETGIDAWGSEYAPASVEYCLDVGLPVIRTFPDNPDDTISGAPFDSFASFNFMEHWPDPNAVLRSASRNLVDGGIGLVEVPNFDMIVRSAMFSEFIPDHLCYFTRETLMFALHYNGFEVLESDVLWYDYIISAVVRKRQPLNLGYFVKKQEQITTEISEFLDRYPAMSVAVWGAGHQALAVMAMAGLGGKILYVVDSAPFKQGRYTTATHIPIVSPSELTARPPAAVMVMAASYSDEVVGTLQKSYPATIDVVVLRDDGLERVR